MQGMVFKKKQLLNPAATGSNRGIPENILVMLLRFIDSATPEGISGQQRLNNVNQTHPVLVSGKPVLKKREGCGFDQKLSRRF